MAPEPSWLERGLRDAGLAHVDPAVAARAWLAAIVLAAPLVVLAAGTVLAVATVAGIALAPPVGARLLAGRSARQAELALPELLEAVSRSLRAGATLHAAVHDAVASAPAPLAAELTDVRREIDAGSGLVDALDRWAARSGSRPVRLVVAALASSAESGGAGARAIDGVAASLRGSAGLAAEVRALSSQARYSGIVIGLAPLAFSLLALGADPRTARFLLDTPVGQACLIGGLALDGLGAWWMHRVASEVSCALG